MAFRLALVAIPNVDTAEVVEPPEIIQPIIFGNTTLNGAAQILCDLLTPVPSNDINSQSRYHDIIPIRIEQQQQWYPCEVSSWASGGGHGLFNGDYRFQDDSLTAFFEQLFRQVADLTNATLCRNNLFHSHAVFDVDTDSGEVDFRMVFHAFEYPEGLEQEKSNLAHLLEPGPATFTTHDDNFYRRNAIWSMRENKIYIPNYQDCFILMDDFLPYGPLLKVHPLTGSREACAVEPDRVGDALIDFNYFPMEEVHLFLKKG